MFTIKSHSSRSPYYILLIISILAGTLNSCNSKQAETKLADKPLYKDPIHNGAADPVVIWNAKMKKHVMYYTNRRANVVDEEGVSWVHGTRIGMAVSEDNGATWKYLDTCSINYRPDPEPTYWAPDVIEHEGTYHMYLTYVPGVFADWSHPRYIIHLTSSNGVDWRFQSKLPLANEKVLDATIFTLPEGGWRMWYNNEMDKKSMYYAESNDLYNWTDIGKAKDIGRGEGAKVFRWKNKYWMLTDEWRGLGAYSSDDLINWEKEEQNLLSEPGTGEDDGVKGQHCDVVVNGEQAYIFYFTHPGRIEGTDKSDQYNLQRSTIQVAELELDEGGKLQCDRDKEVYIKLKD